MSIAPRITLYALIYGIEIDLKNFLKEVLRDSFVGNENIVSKTKERYVKAKGEGPKKDSELIDFLDFGDIYQILLAEKERLSADIRKDLVKHREKLDAISSIRNRVMHPSRPLEVDDYYTVHEFARQVSKNNTWPRCKEMFYQVQEETPDHFLNRIPKTEIEEKVIHNLPVPDFDETGFVGRKDDVTRIKKQLSRKHQRIITLYGEGGIGKTAVMLKTAYDIIYDDECQFEWVIWITCKTKVLTNKGIKEIDGAIRSFKSMTQGIDNMFREIPKTATLKETIDSILDSMRQVKTLLILDNLETLQSEQEMMDFLNECQEVGKIAITSRIGLGQLDLPIKLDSMKEIEAEKLLREFARVRNVKLLYSLPKEQMQKYVRDLFLNPLCIKWFVQAVASGNPPNEVFSNIFTNEDRLLDYCLSSVYKKLDEEQKTFLHIILVNGKPTSKEELLFYKEGKNEINVKDSLNRLVFTSFVKIVRGEDGECGYDITDFARTYVLIEDPPSEKFCEKIMEKQNMTNGFREQIRIQSRSPYHPRYIDIRKDSESVLAIKLSEALKLRVEAIRAKEKGSLDKSKVAELYERALKKVSEVKEIQPSYFEAYRVSAFIYAEQRNYPAAEYEYQKALELEPDNSRIHHFYAGFLQRQLNNMEKAKEHAEIALNIDENSFETRYFYARCIGILGDYDRAIQMLKGLIIGEEHSLVEKRITATQITEFYKRKVEKKKDKEKDYQNAWRFFLKGVSFFETLEEINPDKTMKKTFVNLLDEGSQCIQDNEQRSNKLSELKSRYIDWIYDFDERGHLLKGNPIHLN